MWIFSSSLLSCLLGDGRRQRETISVSTLGEHGPRQTCVDNSLQGSHPGTWLCLDEAGIQFPHLPVMVINRCAVQIPSLPGRPQERRTVILRGLLEIVQPRKGTCRNSVSSGTRPPPPKWEHL